MKTGRCEIYAFNSKGEKVSEVYRFETQNYMHFLDVLNILRALTKYEIELKGGLGRHGRKNHEVLTFEQLCKVIHSKVFKETITKTVSQIKEIKIELFEFTAPEDFRIVATARREWHSSFYTFFDIRGGYHKYIEGVFALHDIKLGVSKNNYYFLNDLYSFSRDKDNPIKWKVFKIKNEVVSTTEVETVITL